MKTLFVIRHAKSSWDDPMQDDFERPLNNRGERDAPNMGKRLKEKHVVPDLMLSSPAKRALDTCEKIAHILNYPHDKIKTSKALYHASDDTIIEVLKTTNDKHDVVLMFGHNPGLTDFVNRLAEAFIDNIPTCGIVSFSLPVDSWKELAWGEAKIEFFDYPKKKD